MNRLAGAALLSVLAISCRREVPDGKPLRVAAAADLVFAFKEMGEAFGKKSGTKLTFTFGSSGNLEKQIEDGGPFDVFAAANVDFADRAVAAGACLAETKALYARGHLVMWTREGKAPAKLADLAAPEVKKIAIANPEHAPYGKAAKQALEKAGVWKDVEKKIVYGENIQQTFEFAKSGNADVALVSLSLAKAQSAGASTPIDEAGHDPIDQAIVVCKGERGLGAHEREARAFTAFVVSNEGKEILRRHGLVPPGEAAPPP